MLSKLSPLLFLSSGPKFQSTLLLCSSTHFYSTSKDARDSAALLARKVYYFLGEYDEALSFALRAGNVFEAESRAYEAEEYVETVVCE